MEIIQHQYLGTIRRTFLVREIVNKKKKKKKNIYIYIKGATQRQF